MDDIEKALDYLEESIPEYEEISGKVIYHRERLKIVEAIEFNEVEKGGETTKRMIAKASQAYQKALNDLSRWESKLISIKSRRDVAEKKISLYQSKLKAKTQGVII